MKKIIAATMLLGTMNAFAGPYSIKFNKPLTLRGNSLINVEKVENKAESGGKWVEKVSNTTKQNCEFAINIEGRDIAVENKAIGEHYYGNMTVSCEKTGFLGDAFKTTFSRVLLLGIRECVVSETVIDNDYCSLEVLALRKETDLSTANGDLISDKVSSRKFYRIHSQTAKSYAEKNALIPNGVNKSLIDSYQNFTMSIGKNGNEFFVPAQNANSSFVSGRNIFLKITDADLNRDVDLRNTIQANLKELENEVMAITSGAKPGEVFKQKIGGVIAKFSATVQKLLGIISPVEFYDLEKQLKEFESNLVATAKTFNPNITNRDSFKSNYGAEGASLSVMMDYLTAKPRAKVMDEQEYYQSPSLEGIYQLQAMYATSFESSITEFYASGVQDYNSTMYFYNRIGDRIDFNQFKIFIKLLTSTSMKNEIIQKFYYLHNGIMTKRDFDEIIGLIENRDNGSSVKANLNKHWSALHSK
jgi:hypothetical protein